MEDQEPSGPWGDVCAILLIRPGLMKKTTHVNGPFLASRLEAVGCRWLSLNSTIKKNVSNKQADGSYIIFIVWYLMIFAAVAEVWLNFFSSCIVHQSVTRVNFIENHCIVWMLHNIKSVILSYSNATSDRARWNSFPTKFAFLSCVFCCAFLVQNSPFGFTIYRLVTARIQ